MQWNVRSLMNADPAVSLVKENLLSHIYATRAAESKRDVRCCFCAQHQQLDPGGPYWLQEVGTRANLIGV